MSAPPPFAVDYDTRFVQVDLDGDLDAWADTSAKRVWEHSGQKHGRGEVKRLARVFRAMGEVVRPHRPLAAFLLAPEPWVGVAGVVRVTPVDLGRDLDRDAVVAGMSYPEQQLVEPCQLAELPTPAGTATRLSQRIVEPGSTEREVIENVQYVWLFPERQAALVMGTSFTDLIEAARWRSALDALASGVSLLDGPVPAGS